MPTETDLMAPMCGAEPVVAGERMTAIAGADSQFDDLQKIASNGHIHDELLKLLQETAP